MKNAFLLIAAGVLAFGCSGDDDNGGRQTDKVLIKKITEIIYEDGASETSIADFTYNGDQLVKFGTSENYTEITYSGNWIVASTHHQGDFPVHENVFTYSGDRLVHVTSNEGERILFAYSGGNVSQTQSQYFDEGVWVTNDTKNYQYSNGNVTQMTAEYDYGGSFSGDYRYTFSNDTKNNPFRDMHLVLRQLFPLEGVLPMNKNNTLASQYFSSATATVPEASYNYEIVYNAANFPTSIKRKNSDGEVITETLFEYQ